MTRTEKRIILDEYSRYAIAYGYYLEELQHTEDKLDRVSLASGMDTLSKQMNALYDLIQALGLALTEDYTSKGRQRYLENHNLNKEG